MNRRTVLAYIGLLYFFLIASISVLGLYGCGGTETQPEPDTTPAYSEVNYLSVETSICGTYAFGLNGCYIPEGSAAKGYSLKVQGFAKGTITVLGCSKEVKRRYSQNQLIAIPLDDLYEKAALSRSDSCTFRVIVAPDYIEGSTDKIFPRLGKVTIEVHAKGVTPLKRPMGQQVRESNSIIPVVIDVPSTEGEFLFSGCGSEYRGQFFNGKATLPAFDLKKDCLYVIGFKAATGERYLWSHYVSVYKAKTILLPRVAKFKSSSEFCIEAGPTTTFIALNNEWSNSNRICADLPGPFRVRTFTVKRNSYEFVRP